MRIVVDSNVLLAAMFTRGVCEALLDVCITSDEHAIILSEHILEEFSRHANDKFGAPEDKVDQSVEVLRCNCDIIDSAAVPADACRDPDDLPILGTAVAGQADCIVTGDQDLLVLRTFGSIAIISPRTLYDHLLTP